MILDELVSIIIPLCNPPNVWWSRITHTAAPSPPRTTATTSAAAMKGPWPCSGLRCKRYGHPAVAVAPPFCSDRMHEQKIGTFDVHNYLFGVLGMDPYPHLLVVVGYHSWLSNSSFFVWSIFLTSFWNIQCSFFPTMFSGTLTSAYLTQSECSMNQNQNQNQVRISESYRGFTTLTNQQMWSSSQNVVIENQELTYMIYAQMMGFEPFPQSGDVSKPCTLSEHPKMKRSQLPLLKCSGGDHRHWRIPIFRLIGTSRHPSGSCSHPPHFDAFGSCMRQPTSDVWEIYGTYISLGNVLRIMVHYLLVKILIDSLAPLTRHFIRFAGGDVAASIDPQPGTEMISLFSHKQTVEKCWWMMTWGWQR